MYAIRSYYDQKGVKLYSAKVFADGELDLEGLLGENDGIRPGFERIDLQFDVRITSYNVCYTKLLRSVETSKSSETPAAAAPSVFIEASAVSYNFV